MRLAALSEVFEDASLGDAEAAFSLQCTELGLGLGMGVSVRVSMDMLIGGGIPIQAC